MLIVYDILKEIHHTIFERGIDFTPINSPVINLKVIVNNLAKYKKIKLNEYKSLASDYRFWRMNLSRLKLKIIR